MSTKKCPGQDTRYWKPEDIFNVKCTNCGSIVEFFKDDVKLKCHKCSYEISNPRIDLKCAEWCKHAKECLGYDPDTK